MDEKELTKPVLFGDLIEATKALAEEIHENYLEQDEATSIVEQLLDLAYTQARYFSDIVGAISFVLTYHKIIDEVELDMLSNPEFSLDDFLQHFISRVTNGEVNLSDLKEDNSASDPDDNIPTGKA